MDPDDVLPVLVARRAAQIPDQEFMTEVGSPPVTFAALHDLGMRWSRILQDAGVRRGERVVVVSAPSTDAFAAWVGLAWIGATPVFVNPSLTGAPLIRALRAAQGATLLTWPAHRDAIKAARELSLSILRFDDRRATRGSSRWRGRLPWLSPQPHDTAAVLFTSGTTGFPKPVAVSWAQLHSAATGHIPPYRLRQSDVWYSPFPLSHVSGLFPTYVMALVNGRVVVRDRFRTQDFWHEVREHGCTVCLMFGATATFLLDADAREDDFDNPLRAVIGFFPRTAEFLRRFDIAHHFRAYNQTEVSVPIATASAGPVPDERTCGKVRDGFEVRIVDEQEHDVAIGAVGELIVRSADPLVLTSGYIGNVEATDNLWRNGWLHTGDLLTRNADGWFYFIDRASDSIRRRGENISSVEVETEALNHPDVVEAAAIGVPATDGDEELKLIVLPRAGSTITAENLRAALREHLPSFMVPRYVEFVGALPRTETGKVRKKELAQNHTSQPGLR